jgi:hypothetical protein
MSHGFPRRLRKDRRKYNHQRKLASTSTRLELPRPQRFSTAALIADIERSKTTQPAFSGVITELATAANQP